MPDAEKPPNEVVSQASERLRANPDDVLALIERATAYLALRDGAKALPDAERAAALLAAHPLPDAKLGAISLAHVHRLAARALGGTGRHADALQAVERALRALPGDAQSLKIRGKIRRDLGDLAGGARDYEAALAADPHDPDGPTLLQVLLAHYEQTGQIDPAHRTCDRILALDPANVAVLLDRAEIWVVKNQYAGAAADLARAAQLDPTNPDVPFNLALMYQLAGERAAAREAVEVFLRLAPGDAQGLALLRELER
jgi:tetratricopeptide (TPR) repeat protein